MTITIAREGKPPITINPPEDPALLMLWNLALSKFAARTGTPPSTREDANEIIEDYHALMAKPRGSVADIIRERCPTAPGGD